MRTSQAFLASTIFAFSSFGWVEHADAAPGAATRRSDEVLASRIEDAIHFNPVLDSDVIKVQVREGIVTLSGTVSSEIERELVGDVALAIEGIESVKNDLKVDESLDERQRAAFAQKIRDLTTTAIVRDKLLANRLTATEQINVSTADDEVTLHGSVSDTKVRETAEDLALSAANVVDVHNDITVQNAKGITGKIGNAVQNVSDKVSDTWISAKIRSLLVFGRDFPGSKIHVATDKGVVTLTGAVRSAAQRDQLEAAVMAIRGVVSVRNMTEVRHRNPAAE